MLALLATLTSSQAQSKEKVDALIMQLKAASNQHDTHAFAQCFTNDADFTNVRGTAVHGRQSIEDFHRPLFAEKPVAGVPSFYKAVLNV